MISSIRFANILLAAILAGTSFGIWIGFNPLNVSPTAYIEQQQNTIRSLNTLMISLVVTATCITLLSAFLQKNNKFVFYALLAAAVFYAACILISRFGNQPINNVIMSWSLDAYPDDWTSYRDLWWNFHIWRTIAELIAFCLIAWVSIKRD